MVKKGSFKSYSDYDRWCKDRGVIPLPEAEVSHLFVKKKPKVSKEKEVVKETAKEDKKEEPIATQAHQKKTTVKRRASSKKTASLRKDDE